MATVKFTYGEEDPIEVRAPLFPFTVETRKLVAVDFSAGGTLDITKLGSDVEVRVYAFDNIPDSQRNALKSFFEDTIDGPMTEFTFTDSDETEYTVRWMDPTFDWIQTAHNRHRGDVALYVVPS